MSVKQTKRVQRKMQAIEKKLAWLKKEASKDTCAETFCIDKSHVDVMNAQLDRLIGEAKALHDAMNGAALSSSDAEIAALAGPGQKGDD